jgi:hypothetical protein
MMEGVSSKSCGRERAGEKAGGSATARGGEEGANIAEEAAGITRGGTGLEGTNPGGSSRDDIEGPRGRACGGERLGGDDEGRKGE